MKTLAIMAIPLTQGLFALVDGRNFEWLNQWKWYAKKQKNGNFYAQRQAKQSVGKWKTILMHREIMKTSKGAEVDHIGHYGLDNRKRNLRNCTHAENVRYQRTQSRNKSSKYKGVVWHKYRKRWQGQISYENKRIYLGFFKNEIKAAKMYDNAAKRLFGEYALTNFKVNDGE